MYTDILRFVMTIWGGGWGCTTAAYFRLITKVGLRYRHIQRQMTILLSILYTRHVNFHTSSSPLVSRRIHTCTKSPHTNQFTQHLLRHGLQYLAFFDNTLVSFDKYNHLNIALVSFSKSELACPTVYVRVQTLAL